HEHVVSALERLRVDDQVELGAARVLQDRHGLGPERPGHEPEAEVTIERERALEIRDPDADVRDALDQLRHGSASIQQLEAASLARRADAERARAGHDRALRRGNRAPLTADILFSI